MQQKAQIINTILHQPELVIIDEPFAALDPVNTQLVKDLMRELRDQGTTILMSTHQMRQVEELCDRILLIDEGMVTPFNAEKTLTKDTVPVDVDAVLFWVVWDAEPVSRQDLQD